MAGPILMSGRDSSKRCQLPTALFILHRNVPSILKIILLLKPTKNAAMLKWTMWTNRKKAHNICNSLNVNNSLDSRMLGWLAMQELLCNAFKYSHSTLQVYFCSQRVCIQTNWRSSTRVHLISKIFWLQMIHSKLSPILLKSKLGSLSLVLNKLGT